MIKTVDLTAIITIYVPICLHYYYFTDLFSRILFILGTMFAGKSGCGNFLQDVFSRLKRLKGLRRLIFVFVFHHAYVHLRVYSQVLILYIVVYFEQFHSGFDCWCSLRCNKKRRINPSVTKKTLLNTKKKRLLPHRKVEWRGIRETGWIIGVT